MVGPRPRLASPALDGLAVACGEAAKNIAALLYIETTVHQVRQQPRRDCLVLGTPIFQPERNLHAVGGDSERDHARVILQPDPVDHQRRERHAPPSGGSSASSAPRAYERRMSATPPTSTPIAPWSRRLCRPAPASAGTGGGHAGEQPLEHHPRQRVMRREIPRPYGRRRRPGYPQLTVGPGALSSTVVTSTPRRLKAGSGTTTLETRISPTAEPPHGEGYRRSRSCPAVLDAARRRESVGCVHGPVRCPKRVLTSAYADAVLAAGRGCRRPCHGRL